VERSGLGIIRCSTRHDSAAPVVRRAGSGLRIPLLKRPVKPVADLELGYDALLGCAHVVRPFRISLG